MGSPKEVALDFTGRFGGLVDCEGCARSISSGKAPSAKMVAAPAGAGQPLVDGQSD